MNPILTDPFGRHIEYLRLSVTDKCDLRCFYCLPKGFKGFEEPERWLTTDEVVRVVRAFSELGVRRIRLTGGEPLVRRGIIDIARGIGGLPGVDDLSLSTNATQLARHAEALKGAGVARINVSLDTLRPKRFKEITGGGDLQQVLDGLEAAHRVGLRPVKINMVVMKGVNDDEVVEMAEYCAGRGFTLRYIETMPVGDAGRHASEDRYLGLDEVRARLAERFELIPDMEAPAGGGPARYVRVAGTDLHIGFITPISQHFCETCNRVRLAVDGTLYMCLGQDHSYELRPLLRAGCSDDELKEAILQAIALKPEKHEFREKPGQVIRHMSLTGG